jgi:hypothetical protein
MSPLTSYSVHLCDNAPFVILHLVQKFKQERTKMAKGVVCKTKLIRAEERLNASDNTH